MSTFSTKAISGIVLFLAGIICIMFPIMGALDVEAMLGIVILLSGIFHLVGAVEQKSSPDFLWGMMNSLAFLGFGLFLLADPYQGLQLMAIILFLFLISHSLFTIGTAFSQKTYHPRWFWTLFSALLSLTLAVVIFFGYAVNDPWTTSMLVGVAILGYGMSMLVTSGVVSSDDEAPAKPKAKAPAAAKAKPAAVKKAAPKKKPAPQKAAPKKAAPKKKASAKK